MRTNSLFLLCILLIATIATAQESGKSSGALPARGTDKATVESKYGAPNRKQAPVGDPPITRWIYPNFTVVFEHNHVVHAFERSDVVENISTSDLPPRPDLTLPYVPTETAPVQTIKPTETQSPEPVSTPTTAPVELIHSPVASPETAQETVQESSIEPEPEAAPQLP